MKNSIYRKVLDIKTKQILVNNSFYVIVKEVLWIAVKSETTKVDRAERAVMCVYINGKRKLRGHAAWFFKKPVSFSKINPLKTRILQQVNLDRLSKQAFDQALMFYLETLTNLEGSVQWFDRNSGEGSIHIPALDIYTRVYACNLKGKKTWYSETACVYLEKDQTVKIERLGRIDAGLTPIINEGVIFDEEKWISLDQSKLAFRCDENGKAINGLFA